MLQDPAAGDETDPLALAAAIAAAAAEHLNQLQPDDLLDPDRRVVAWAHARRLIRVGQVVSQMAESVDRAETGLGPMVGADGEAATWLPSLGALRSVAPLDPVGARREILVQHAWRDQLDAHHPLLADDVDQDDAG